MYHKVGQPVTCKRDAFLNVSAPSFQRQMRLLARLGYRARPFAEVVEALACRSSLPRRTFAITFDDGYCSVGGIAAPILAEYRFPATLFVASDWVGKTNAWDRQTGRPELPLLDWADLCALVAAGWEIGGHTRTHPHLDGLGDADAFAEILSGKQETEARLGVPLRTFCYPFGHFNTRTPALVRRAGFRGACTTRSGLAQAAQDPFALSRIKVSYSDGILGLFYRMLVRPYMPNTRPLRRSHRTPLPAHVVDFPK
jgi:peptidoglycan/xylan/chitin deacetylase (PgdA/CDA1 family)